MYFLLFEAVRPLTVSLEEEEDRSEGMEAAKSGEIRRVNLVYFLSRDGRVEHPHLIRVHHLHRHGVRLLDVKRWLAEIRGKEMPNSFAWSYKRRYRNGYVWQDLADDDLITPISDNEYVLKGSELIVNPPPTSALAKNRLVSLEEEEEEASDVKSTTKAAAETLGISGEEDDDEDSSLKSSPPPQLMKKLDESAGSRRASLLAGAKDDGGGNYSKRATEALWNILTCREAGANETVFLPSASRRGHRQSNGSTAAGGRTSSTGGDEDTSRIREEKARSGGKGSNKAGANGVHPAAHKPSASPLCSQCGKAFKPEKLYSHMKSCKGVPNGKEKIQPTRASSSSNSKSKLKPKLDDKSREAPAIPLTR